MSGRDAAGSSLLLAAAAGVLLFLPGLGNHDLWAPDEPRYAQVGREMLQGGDWLLPHVNGRVYPDKPPGYFWLAALLSFPQGDVTAFTARLPSALCGVGLLALAAGFGARLLGRRAGLLGAAALATSFDFFTLARSAHLDTLLSLLVGVSLLCAWRLFCGGGAGTPTAALFWIAVGGAALVKGPVGLLLPILVVAADRMIAGEPRDLLRLRPAWGTPLMLSLPCGWLAAVSALRPDYDAAGVLERHVWSRFASGLHHRNPPWYYLEAFSTGFFPWSFLVPAALVLAWTVRARARAAAEREDEGLCGPAAAEWSSLRFLLVWLFATLLFFSLSSEKRGLYILPAYPSAALLVGFVWERLLAGAPAGSRLLVRLGLSVPAGVLLALPALPFVVQRLRPDLLDGLGRPLAAIAVAGLVGGGVILWTLAQGRRAAAVVTLASATLAVLLVFAQGIQPALNGEKSARYLAERLAATADPGDAVGMYQMREGYVYYSGRRLVELGDERSVAAFLSQPRPAYLIIEKDALDRFTSRLGPVTVLAEHGVDSRRTLLLSNARLGARGPAGRM